jgi:hypothetical protein
MLAHEQMKWGARALAAILGGPGIFYLWLSFNHPENAITAVIYLALATALSIYAGEPSARPARRKANFRLTKRKR